MHKFLLPPLFVFLIPFSAISQVLGVVKDATTDEPLIGAVVMSSVDTVVTGKSGSFSITTDENKLTIQYLGYNNLTIHISDEKNVTAELTPSNTILGEVIVTSGSRGVSLYNTPTSINVINKSMLERDAPFTVTNSINRIPGVLMSSGTYNTNRITIRGIGSRSPYGTTKVKAYYDEIPLTDGSGNSTIEDIDQSLIQRIEIIKGPNSSAYGAGLGGTIRLHSFKPEPLSTRVEAGWTTGSFGTNRFTARVAHNNGKNSVAVSYNNLSSEGYRDNSEFKKDQFGLNYRLRLTSKSTLSLLGQFTKLNAYIPSSIDREDFENNPEKAAFTWDQAKGYESYDKGLFGATYHHIFSSEWDLKSTVFGKYRDAYEPRPFNILSENTQSIGTRNIASKRWQQIEIGFGIEVYADRYEWQTLENNYTEESNGSVEGELLSDNRENRQYFNSFAELTWKVSGQLRVLGGLNWNYTRYDLSDLYNSGSDDISGSYDFDPVLSPKIGLLYNTGANTLFANISHGFSPPSLEETLYPEGQINPNIKPESGWNYEIGTRGSFSNFNYDITAYFMKIKDLLVAQRTAEDAYVGVNAGLNNHFGIDGLLNYKVFKTNNYELLAFTSASFTDFEFAEFTHNDQNFSGNQLTGVPKWMVSPGLELISKEGFYGNFNGQYVGKIPLDDANSIFVDDYLILRAKVGYRYQISHISLDANVGVDNMAGTQYASMLLINATGFNGSAPRYYYPGYPRNFFAGIRLSYEL